MPSIETTWYAVFPDHVMNDVKIVSYEMYTWRFFLFGVSKFVKQNSGNERLKRTSLATMSHDIGAKDVALKAKFLQTEKN